VAFTNSSDGSADTSAIGANWSRVKFGGGRTPRRRPGAESWVVAIVIV
jgi:hypothetical protein